MIEISPFMFGVIMIEDGMSCGIIKCLPSSTLHHSQQFPLDLSIELMPQLNKNDGRLKIKETFGYRGKASKSFEANNFK